MDCLAILKEFCLTGQLGDVNIQGDRVLFADKYSFPKQSPTAFKARDGTGDYYSLEAVTFFIKTIVANPSNMGAYVAAAVRTKVHQIELRDREPLRDYLTGKIQHTPHIADVVPVASYEPAAKRQRTDDASEGEAAALSQLFEQEKQLRTRNSLLCAPGANFQPVLDMLDKVLMYRKLAEGAAATANGAKPAPGKQQQHQKPAQHAQRPAPAQQQKASPMAFMKPSGRMERDDAGAGLLAQLGGDAAGIAANIGRGYGIQAEVQKPSQPSAAAAGGSSAKPSSQQQPQQQQRSSSKQDPRAAAAGGSRPSGSSSHHHHQKGGSSVSKHKDPPIILVPSGITAMFNIFNAKQFLEEGKFVPSAEAAAAVGNMKPTKALEFQRTALRKGPRFPRYQITDKVPREGSPDWKRVVAVVVQGKPWQFKDFPFKGAAKGDLMDTFTHLFGAYFHYADEPVPDAVNGWKVAKLPLRRTARHLDNTVMLDFYQKLDAFLQAKRCELDY